MQTESKHRHKKHGFTGQIGFVMAAAGSAVGVGNLWRFPYLAAKDGGGLFILIYLILTFTFGFTLLTSDIAIGRRTGKNSINAYAEMSPKWKFLGILTFLVPVLIKTYYAVIGGCSSASAPLFAEKYGIDTTKVHKTQSFNLPIRKYRMGEHKGLYKIPSGSTIYACFSSDFFHPVADEWRNELWDMIKERSDCTFFMITKRPERIKKSLPADWDNGWENVHIACTCENQWTANHRLPIFLPLPIKHKSITHEPMLERIDIRPFLKEFGKAIDSVSCGGESGPEARPCDYKWILDTHVQCVEYGVPFHYHQTGAKLIKNGKIYEIPREHPHEQAHKAGLDYGGGLEIPECLNSGCE